MRRGDRCVAWGRGGVCDAGRGAGVRSKGGRRRGWWRARTEAWQKSFSMRTVCFPPPPKVTCLGAWWTTTQSGCSHAYSLTRTTTERDQRVAASQRACVSKGAPE